MATASLAGQVTTSGGLSPAGIQVSLKYRTAQGTCGGTEAETTTDGDGSFLFEAVRRALRRRRPDSSSAPTTRPSARSRR